MGRIRVAFVGLKYDYGFSERGYSFEYTNFFHTLANMENIEVTLFPFDEVMREQGRDGMNRQLLNTIADLQPDICFFFLFTDEIKKQTLRTLRDAGKTVIINWFADDQWRFEEFSQYWAPLFHWIVTTDRKAIDKYNRIGYRNAILSQWGANHFLYRHFNVPKEYDVSFVGQVHSNRKNLVKELDRSGIRVECWGKGWPKGRLSQDEMISLFSKSKINLNFTDSAVVLNIKQLVKIFLNRRADDTLRLKMPMEMFAHVKTLLCNRRAQIKGRNFEIPAAGGFLLTQYADGIEEYFIPGKEIVTFTSASDLCNKIHYYLSHDSERELIRLAGHKRVLREHTLQRRFEDIFEFILNQQRRS
jgi:spore maturation protein CgeB